MNAVIDLSKLPAPQVIEPLDFEAIRADILADLVARHPALAPALTLESEVAVILAEAFAYQVMLLRARVNDAAKSVLLAHATGADLDALAAGFDVARAVVVPANPDASPPVTQVMEDDARLRARVQLAYEGLSVAGPAGAYRFHALSADGTIADVSVASPQPCQVLITLLGKNGNGMVDEATISRVLTALNDENVRPLTDQLIVQSAEIIPFEVAAQITLLDGPDGSTVLGEARARLARALDDNRALGRDVTRSSLIAALHCPGVQNVLLTSPATDIEIDSHQAGYCSQVTLVLAGRDA